MLVLSRKEAEQIVITVPPAKLTTKIIVKVSSIRGDKVRIGIDAPTSARVDRQEVYDLIAAEQSKKAR